MAIKKILLLGSGFVAEPCVEYLCRRPENKLTIAARRLHIAQELAGSYDNTTAISLDVNDEAALDAVVAEHDVVISLIPYTFHAQVIKSALKSKTNVVTTSYVSPAMMAFDEAAKAAGVVVMNEIGVDPGVDHLYALKTINEVHAEGGKVLSFLSYCGGLPAPEASNNPLGYKFSWSSRGVLLALKNNAKFYENGDVVEYSGNDLMNSAKPIPIYPAFAFVGYPNRDSTPYKERYNIPEAHTILRGTLRYAGFPQFVKALVDIGFLDDAAQDFLAADASDVAWNDVLAKRLGSSSNSEADLVEIIKEKSSIKGDEIERIIKGLKWLGMFSETLVHRRGNYLDTLCATLEDKMMYAKGERDMVMLQHKFEIELKDGTRQTRTSTVLEYGNPEGASAMARLVGMPCGVATQLVLDGVINTPGVLAPMSAEINDPLIKGIEAEGVVCHEEIL
ncbi:saccharopine dehydrogenase (NADP+, L-glutamate-forming) [Podila verticillata]|uniref:Saccharopine dehydrogenase [NADP(+), L-glutamate-forming] n=1 Tax=Podila verticillata NRRL 6337 TaxID=1069443 RepID=A0A086TM40_9FUNG|nr:saccharopine dehydrogenase (NADP+, L-glutamate-forming) [Haplosporangium bisporale]KAF9204164.1 saccharopine dehydrogenase (NADP+, L-glutamate-forming) [Podila verticillata]KAF9387916.1 saccharopine dehydrogenase (NADP+, L-glutamate-forming) [Podila verticillata]KAI9241552.1 MAG: Saccharopine dehydrogenase [Podila humilis]KFH63017.1 saccharopine dehydrogenase [Podila verticillata NRRL 6337]